MSRLDGRVPRGHASRLVRRGSALLVLAAALAGCSGGGSPTAARTPSPIVVSGPTPSSNPVGGTAPPVAAPTTAPSTAVGTAPSSPRSGAAVPAPLVVTIRNFAFLPQNPVLAPGQGVVIINRDTAAHTWTAAPQSGWTFDSGNIAPGSSARFPGFAKAGRYPVLCLYHAEMPAMTGTITVR